MPSGVLVTYKIMPESVETDLEKIKSDLAAAGLEIKDMKEEPIAFGLKALKVLILLQDQEGGTEEAEAKINAIDGIQSVETEGITLI